MVANETGRQYEIVVRGRLSERYGAAFDGMTLRSQEGVTTLRGAILDQSQLYGLINRLRDLGIELLSVKATEELDGDGDWGRRERART